MRTGRVVLLLWVLLLPASQSLAYRNLKIGGTVDEFMLLDQTRNKVASKDLWNDVTVLLTIDTPEEYAKRALDDLAELAVTFKSDHLTIRVVIRSDVHDGVLLGIPPELRESALFDPAHTQDGALGFVVLPATGVFDKKGQLLAYIPLWRQTYREELEVGIRKSFDPNRTEDLATVWQPGIRRQDVLEAAERLQKAGATDSALALLRHATQTDTNWAQGRVMLGNMLIQLERYDDAYEVFRFARETSGANSAMYIGLAQSLIGRGQPDSALYYLAVGRSLSGNPQMFLKLEGEIFLKQSWTDSALVRWRTAVESLLGISQ